MAKNVLGDVPFPPLVRVESDTPLKEAQIRALLEPRPEGVSFCVRSTTGHANRGGYFFHLMPGGDDLDKCQLFNFEKTYAATLDIAKLTALVNHCSGLQFDESSFQLCQTQINFRLDPEPEAEEPEDEGEEEA